MRELTVIVMKNGLTFVGDKKTKRPSQEEREVIYLENFVTLSTQKVLSEVSIANNFERELRTSYITYNKNPNEVKLYENDFSSIMRIEA